MEETACGKALVVISKGKARRGGEELLKWQLQNPPPPALPSHAVLVAVEGQSCRCARLVVIRERQVTLGGTLSRFG